MDVLDHEVMIRIFSHVESADVARLRAVCRTWDAVIQQAEVARAVLKRTWGITELVGYPRKKSLYLVAGLSHFAIQHTCRYWETLTSVAVHYNVDVAAVRVLNNLISEHSLRSRQYVYVPVRREQIRGKAARFIYDKVVDRDLIVILDNINELLAETPECEKCDIASSDSGILKMSQLLGRGLRIDENTAKFYLADADGDVKKAIRLYEEDRRWEFKGR